MDKPVGDMARAGRRVVLGDIKVDLFKSRPASLFSLFDVPPVR
jgi:hypothetical protein